MIEPNMRNRFQRLVEELKPYTTCGATWSLKYREAAQRIDVRLPIGEGKETATVNAKGVVSGSQSPYVDILRVVAYSVWRET